MASLLSRPEADLKGRECIRLEICDFGDGNGRY